MTIFSLEEWKKKKTKSKDEGFTLTIANAVFKYLNALVDDRPKRRTRWIWELLQNAHDASIVSDKRLVASITDNSEELIFLHNGSSFTIEQIQRLVFHGSTKVEDEETIGRYGSGFLTTHLLSWDIDVSGQLDNGQLFDFRLSRNPESVNALSTSMNQAWDDFDPVTSLREPMPEKFTTRFKYPITEIWSKDAVQEGNTVLKQCAPFVVVFNKAFYSIDINEPYEISSFKVVQRCLSIRSGLWEINVIQSINENQTKMKYLLAQGKKASVTVPLRSISNQLECLSVENIPRLFVAFPLMGTEPFSFPAVINGNRKFLKPNENRDGVDLGQGNQLDSDTNRNNQAVIKEACALLTHLFRHATSHSWYHAYQWANVPTTPANEWLKKCIKEKFIENILQTPAILTESGKVIMSKDARLPLAENDEGVTELWGLLNDLHEYHEQLPKKDEATGWWNTIKSWAKLNGCEVSDLPDIGVDIGIIDGRKLADYIANECSCLKDLQNLLRQNVCAVDWLNRFYRFFKDGGLFDDTIRNLHIFPNQVGDLKSLRLLHVDKNIDKKLKEVDTLLGSTIQNQLRDTELTSLEDEEDLENWDNKHAVGKLIKSLQDCVNNPNDNFKAASAQLFAWLVHQNQQEYWNHLLDVPVFTKDSTCYPSLSNGFLSGTPLLAPVRAWPEDLQQFSELFPSDRILDDSFFEVIPDTDLWQMLCEQNFTRRNMIRRWNNLSDLKLFSPEIYENEDDGRDHESAEVFSPIGVVTWEAIMEKVRNSRDNAYLFWRFLTEYLIPMDNSASLAEKTAQCKSCGKSHRYYPSRWLKAVRSNKWIRQGDLRFHADAQSLANLLREKGWNLRSLENPFTVKLLSAINVSPSDLRLELITGNPESRDTLVSTMTELHQITGGDLSQVQAMVQHVQKVDGDLSQTLAVIQHMQEDENFSEYLAERQEQTRRVHENQHLGTQVENLVRENLENEGFLVSHTGIGSDFKIEDAEHSEDLITLNITQNDCHWLVEVKSTRYDRVRMTTTQAQMAVKEKARFLLCVVPLGQETVTAETVRENMRFIQNIGDSVARLCESLDWLEEVRADITADVSSDVELVVEKGKAGILIKKSVWEGEGFPLEKLAENLK